MKGVTKVMGTMNKKMNLPQIQKIMMEFEKQNEMMGACRRSTLRPLPPPPSTPCPQTLSRAWPCARDPLARCRA